MAVQPLNLTQGPATLWYGAFGSAEPADPAVSSSPSTPPWTDIGGTQGGVQFEVDNTYTPQEVDQLVDPVGARLTKRAITVTVKLAETTLNNLLLAQNNLISSGSGTGYITSDPLTTTSATQPTYAALIVDGWAPTLSTGAAARRRIIIRKVLSQAKVVLTYNMQNNTTYDCTFTAYYVSSSIPPYHIVDQTQ
jgi:hypothetical protein